MGKKQLFVLVVVLAVSFIVAEDTPESSAPSEILEASSGGEDPDPASLAAVPFIVDVSSGIPLNDASEKEDILNEPMAATGVTNFVVENIVYNWTIKNYGFNNLEFGEAIYSPLFWGEKSMDYQWQLTLYPRGEHETAKAGVGFYLCLISKKDAMANVKIHIIDKNRNKVHPYTFKRKFNGTSGEKARWGYQNFISQHDLEIARKVDFLPNDKLTLMVEITFSPRMKESSGFCDDPIDDDECPAMPYQNDFHNDIHLFIGNKYVAAQRAALAAHGTWFADQLRINPHIVKIPLPPDVTADEMEDAVKFIYTGTINTDKAQNLLNLANKLGMKQLKARCEEILCVAMAPAHSATNFTENAKPVAQ